MIDSAKEIIDQKLNEATSISLPDFSKLTPHQKMLEQLKKQSNFLRDSTLFVNVYRTKVTKTSPFFNVQHCPFGFGYYSVS